MSSLLNLASHRRASPMVTVWQIANDGDTITIPIDGNGLDVVIQWGDGNSDTYEFDRGTYYGTNVHTYASAGTYIVTIKGTAAKFSMADTDNTSRSALILVRNLGKLGWTDFSYGFADCPNLTKVAGGDVSAVTDMSYMFSETPCRVDTRGWRTSACENMEGMWQGQHIRDYGTAPIGDTHHFDVSNVTNFAYCFRYNRTIRPRVGTWDVSAGTDFQYMFHSVAFPIDVANWAIPAGATITGIFYEAQESKPDVSNWDISGITNIDYVFYGWIDPFGPPHIETWDTSAVTSAYGTFTYAGWRPAIDDWDMSSLATVNRMFALTSFTEQLDISIIPFGQLVNTTGMFTGSTANIVGFDNIDTSNLQIADEMFYGSNLNPAVENWTVTALISAVSMFTATTRANPDLSAWVCPLLSDATSMLELATGMRNRVPARLFWMNPALTTYTSCFEGAVNIANRDEIPSVYGWGGDRTEVSMEFTITVPNDGDTFVLPFPIDSFVRTTVDWDDGSEIQSVESTDLADKSHVYASAGTYTVTISGIASALSFDLGSDAASRAMLTEVTELGNLGWLSFERAFTGCMAVGAVAGDYVHTIENMTRAFANTTAQPVTANWNLAQLRLATDMFRDNVDAVVDFSTWSAPLLSDVTRMCYGAESLVAAVPAAFFWSNDTITAYTACFAHATSIANYDDIPDGWKTDGADGVLEADDTREPFWFQTLLIPVDTVGDGPAEVIRVRLETDAAETVLKTDIFNEDAGDTVILLPEDYVTSSKSAAAGLPSGRITVYASYWNPATELFSAETAIEEFVVPSYDRPVLPIAHVDESGTEFHIYSPASETNAVSYRLEIVDDSYAAVRTVDIPMWRLAADQPWPLFRRAERSPIPVALPTGSYFWRCAALNPSYSGVDTVWTEWESLEVVGAAEFDTSPILLDDSVYDGAVMRVDADTRYAIPLPRWLPRAGVDKYIIDIRSENADQDAYTTLPEGSLLYISDPIAPVVGAYRWRIRARSGTTYTDWSEERTFTILPSILPVMNVLAVDEESTAKLQLSWYGTDPVLMQIRLVDQANPGSTSIYNNLEPTELWSIPESAFIKDGHTYTARVASKLANGTVGQLSPTTIFVWWAPR